jgi:phage terminase small subunit
VLCCLLCADEVLLVYSTIAIHSCANADNAAALDQQIQAIIESDLEQQGQLSVWRQQQQQQQLLAAAEDAAAAGHGSTDAAEAVQFGCAQVCA